MKRIASLGLGKLAILATITVVFCTLVVFGQDMFSAGPLSEQNPRQISRGGVHSHAEITSCSACHAPAWSSETMAMRCMNCHDNISDQIVKEVPMHGKLAAGEDCMSCHTEHKGPHGVLTNMARFDHDCAAFQLTGKHTKVDCAKCHHDQPFQSTAQSCVACHAQDDVHKGQRNNCVQCHKPNTWKEVTLSFTSTKEFDHASTGFKLTHKHAAIDCKSCHVNESFKGLSQSCVSCHAEPPSHTPHPKSFGKNCADCHTTLSWQGATLVKAHRVPLNHGNRKMGSRNNACNVCHKDTMSFVSFPPEKTCPSYASYTCYGCHAHTPAKEANRGRHVTALAKKPGTKLEQCMVCHKNVPNGNARVPRPKAVLVCPEASGDFASDACTFDEIFVLPTRPQPVGRIFNPTIGPKDGLEIRPTEIAQTPRNRALVAFLHLGRATP